MATGVERTVVVRGFMRPGAGQQERSDGGYHAEGLPQKISIRTSEETSELLCVKCRTDTR